jgi:putative ABC transport system permease protein
MIRLFQLSWKQLSFKPLSTLMNIILFALGVGIISLLFLISKEIEEKLDKNQAGIGMVVGAKGSPLQLILCAIFHIDFPTGNIKLKDTAFLKKHPLVSQIIPQALGDSYQTFRIVGTTHEYAKLYATTIQEGELWEKEMEVTLGNGVAQKTGLKVGSTFAGAHGMTGDGDSHEQAEFKVVGILNPTGTVVDQLILTNIESVWEVHEHHEEVKKDSTNKEHDEKEEEHEHEHHEEHSENEEDEKEITTLLVKFRSPLGAIQLPRFINEKTNLQAATPAFEISRLFSLMGVGIDTLNGLAYLIMLVSGLSVFISLFSSLKERKYELAYMRVIGAKRVQLFGMIVLEGILLAFLGYLVGIVLSHSTLWLISQNMEDAFHQKFTYHRFLNEEIYLLFGSLLLGIIASLIPAYQAFKTDISKTLAEN